jgi:hypothetical protein
MHFFLCPSPYHSSVLNNHSYLPCFTVSARLWLGALCREYKVERNCIPEFELNPFKSLDILFVIYYNKYN